MAPRQSAIVRVMSGSGPSTWADAVWIGEVDDTNLPVDDAQLLDSAGFSAARLMVRHGRVPRGFVHLPIVGGRVSAEALRDAALSLPVQPPARADVPTPPISVVICTRDRPALLEAALTSALRLDYPSFEIVVVDNNPASNSTRSIVESFGDATLSVVDAPIQGLSRARNVGLAAARHEIVAFTDDDVVVDPLWLRGIAEGFARAADVACVSGMVPSGELGSIAQGYFDRRVQWASSCDSHLFALADERPGEPLFPFQVGRFGTGANFALRRDVAIELAGFDERLGIGSPTGGGEDIDMFVRVLLAGHRLAYEPSALVWHRHRSDLASLTRQIRDYGTGLGAWIMTLAMNPSTAAMILRRIVPGIRHAWRMTRVDMPESEVPVDFARLSRVERLAILAGPFALLRASRSGALARPLRSIPASLGATPTQYVEVTT
ncbi:MAG: hypothetical protein QOG52_451 [Frankiaceae bacterium]|jgi:GT2 family glycosyltransferase|nr:hypothetical protein [Frankiaceae bacterium]